MTKKEKQNQARRIAEALDRLPEGKAEQRVAFNKDEIMDVKLKLRELESYLDDLCE